MQTTYQLSHFIKEKARELGFHKTGIVTAETPARSAFLEEWLTAGKQGQMHWMAAYAEKRMDVKKLWPDVRSVVSVALNYYTPYPHSSDPAKGKISRYAWGKDYHKIMKKKLKQLLAAIREKDGNIDGRVCVDTAPIQDKLWAAAAGIGWQGKNTNILTRDYGSWIFLGELLLNHELSYDTPVNDYCGTCTACIDACPTAALEPYKIDATKCLSYLTIEYWDAPIPEQHKNKMDNWVFGCDICQDVCPWNRFEKETDCADFQPGEGNVQPSLNELAGLSEEQFKQRFKKSPVNRSKYVNFRRNVLTVMNTNSIREEKMDRPRKLTS